MPTDLDRELDLLLADAATTVPPTASAITSGRKALQAALDNTQDQLAVRRRRVRTTVLATIAAAGVAAAVIGPTVSLPGHHATANADAATVLHDAAEHAEAQQGGWPDANYWHSVSNYVRNGRSFHREIWIGHDRASYVNDPGVKAVDVAIPESSFGPGISWNQLYALPAGPTALADKLRYFDRGQGQDPNQQLFSTAAELLGESPASPLLRSALYQVAARVPGVRADGLVTDRAGRRGQGISRDGESIIIDVTSGQVLQDSQDSDYVATYQAQGPSSTAPSPTPHSK